METKSKLTDWFRKMGYDGEMPDSLQNICNSSTSFIWDHIMTNCKPKQEVDHIKKNIIINRLHTKSRDQFTLPVLEIEVYEKKRALENKINALHTSIKEKEMKIESISKSNNIKYIVIENTKQKIKENEERAYLLETKCKKLVSVDIPMVEETLKLAKNLTPVEMDENINSKDISETLQKCAEKLEKLVQEMSIPCNSERIALNLHNSTKKCEKTPLKHMTFDEYLHQTEIYLDKSKIPKNENKENFPSCRKKLITIPSQNYQKNKPSETASNKTSMLFQEDDDVFKNTPVKVEKKDKKPKRESLGLLPDSCFNNDDLISLNSSSTWISKNRCADELNDIAEVQTLLGKTSEKHEHDSGVSSETRSTFNSAEFKMAPTEVTFDKICSDIEVVEMLQKLLYNNNRSVIWNSLKTINDNTLLGLKNIILDVGKNESNKKVDQEDIAKLHFLHVKTELQTMKRKASIRKLNEKINRRKDQLFSILMAQLMPKEQIDERRRIFDLYLKDVALEATLSCMKTEINNAQKVQGNNDLQVVLKKTTNVKTEIGNKLHSMQVYIDSIYKTLKSLNEIHETSVHCVRTMNHYIKDMSWSQPLTENLWSKEVQLFEKFPLEYNRRFIYTDPKMYYRDICTDSIPSYIDLDNDSLQMMVNILESPYSPPASILLNLLKNKMKLSFYLSLPFTELRKYSKYKLDDLRSQESYVQYAINKISSIIHSSVAKETLSTAAFAKKAFEIWSEMPMKNFISSQRLVDGHEFQYYEKQFDSLYNSL